VKREAYAPDVKKVKEVTFLRTRVAEKKKESERVPEGNLGGRPRSGMYGVRERKKNSCSWEGSPICEGVGGEFSARECSLWGGGKKVRERRAES